MTPGITFESTSRYAQAATTCGCTTTRRASATPQHDGRAAARRRARARRAGRTSAPNIPVLARALPRAGRRSARLRALRQAHRARAVQPLQRHALPDLFDHLGIERVHWWAIRWAAAPRCGSRWTTPSGPGRLVLMGPGGLSSTCSRPTRPRASSCSEVHRPPADAREHGEVPAHHGLRPEADHRRAGRRAVRHRQPPGVAGRRRRWESRSRARRLRARHDVARGLQAAPAGAADLGPRGPGQPARRRAGGAQADPAGAAARLRAVRTLGAAGEVRRVQQAD